MLKLLKSLWPLILLLFFLNLLILATPDKSWSEDLGRHLKLGQIISRTHQVPQTNLFSHTLPDQQFVNHHWLSEVIFWRTFAFGGETALLSLRLFLLNLTVSILWFSLKSKIQTTLLLPLLALGILLFRSRLDSRPELFSYLLLAFYQFLLSQKLSWQRIGILTLLQILWVNLHIYFFLGPLLFLLRQSASFLKNKPAPLFIAPALLIFANLLNPNFVVGALYPLKIFQNYGYSVYENQSIFFLERYFQTFSFYAYKIFLGLTLLSLLFSLGHRHLPAILVQILAIFASLKMVRALPLLPLLALPAMAHNLRLLLAKVKLKTKPQRLNLHLAGLFVFLLVVTTSLATLPQPWRLGLVNQYSQLGEFLAKNQIKDNVFNNYDLGSFLIWQLYPQHRVFVDNRPEAYSPTFFQDIYIPMQQDRAIFEKYAATYHLNTIIWSKTDITSWSQTFVTELLPQLKDWEKVYEDPVAVVYLKGEKLSR